MSTPLIDTLNVLRHVYRSNQSMQVEFSIATLVLGELETISKRPEGVADDATALGIIRKLAKADEETLAVGKDVLTEDKKNRLGVELSWLNIMLDKFAPVQLTQSQIVMRLQQNGVTNVGDAMKWLKANCAGQYDGKAASGWVRELYAA